MDSGWIVAIGASGGAGLEDICDLLSALPPDLDAVVMIVLHRPCGQARKLAEVLSGRSQMMVVVAGQGELLVPGTAYIAEPSIHLTLLDRTFALLAADRARLYGKHTIDLLFQSVADCGGTNTIGVVLSGSLDDGSRGLAAIHHAGGQTMALRPSSLLGHAMPENAIAFDGPVSVIGSGSELAAAIIRLVRPDGKQS